MSGNNIPFDIQTEIMLRLPVKSLGRFQCVSKQWKSLINSTKFINDHQRINREQSQRHLLARHKLHCRVAEYTSFIDDDTFPNHKSSVILPPPLNLMNDRNLEKLNSAKGLLCFYGYHAELETCMIVLWNPTIRKTIGIPIPSKSEYCVFGFGFCRDSSDPKLVMIEGNAILRGGVSYWKVGVFTLSSRVWKTVFNGRPPIGGCLLMPYHVCIAGFIYWVATYRTNDEEYGNSNNVIISFDMKSEEFGQVNLPGRLLRADILKVAEVNESLCVNEIYYDSDDEVNLCGVWMMEFVTKSFTKMLSVKVPDQWLNTGVFLFRKNGEVIIEVKEDGVKKSRLEVLEPSSGRINGIGISGKYGKQRASSYMETLILLDVTSPIISLPKNREQVLSFLDDDVGRYNY